jgi:hypothetical protein
MDDDEWVVAKELWNDITAHLVRINLEALDFDFQIVRGHGAHARSGGPLLLLVRAAEAEEAAEILRELLIDEDPPRDD